MEEVCSRGSPWAPVFITSHCWGGRMGCGDGSVGTGNGDGSTEPADFHAFP